MPEIVKRAVSDARTLREASFDAVVIENFGDVPFPATSSAPAAIAAMAVAADAVRREVGIAVGVNVLRNDARAALGIAAAVGASFIRVNVHTGVCATDQGIIEGRADETLRDRKMLGRRVAILADVHVKHAVTLSHPDIGAAARDTAYRGLADGLIVTGPATGEPVDVEDLRRVQEAVSDRRVFVGSGATVGSVGKLLQCSSGIIVGCGVKAGADPAEPVDSRLARQFADAAGRG